MRAWTRNTRRGWAGYRMALVALTLLGCGESAPIDSGVPMDAGASDAGEPDASVVDSGRDAGVDGGADVDGGDAGAAPGDWQIPAEFRVGSKLTMYPLYPRPDAETSAQAFHRVAHPDVPYRVRVGVQGGEWPFLYELLEAPAGASFIASELAQGVDSATGRVLHTVPEGYGVVRWTPTAGTHDFRVRVTDQDGATAEFTWQVVTDEDAFVFIDASEGNNSAAGTFDAPLETFAAGLWRNDDADTTFAGRVAVFRAGSYDVFAASEGTSPILDPGNKPIAYVGYPGEAVTFDLSRGHFRTTGPGFDDGFVGGIAFSGSRADLPNNRLFNITNDSDRVTFWDVAFDGTSIGTNGNDNPACIAFMSDGPYHENIAILDSRLGSGAATQLVVTFDTDYLLLEGNRAEGVSMPPSNGSYFLHPKDDSNHVTVRANSFSGSVSEVPIAPTNQITLASATDQEVCWNTLLHDGDQNVDAAIEMNGSSSSPDAMNTYVYRNTVVSERRAFRFSGGTSASEFEANAFFGRTAGVFGTNFTEGSVANRELARTDFDAAGRLTGGARDAHGGLAGAEILLVP